MFLHIHKERLDRFDMTDVANEFISRFEKRKEIIGISNNSDIRKKVHVNSRAMKASVE